MTDAASQPELSADTADTNAPTAATSEADATTDIPMVFESSPIKFHSKIQRRGFKQGIDLEDARHKREDVTVELRKVVWHERLAKRRARPKDDKPNDAVAPLAGDFSGADLEAKLARIEELTAGVNSNDADKQLECVREIRKLLSIERSPPIQQVIDSGVVPRLLQLLTFSHNNTLQFEAAWAVTNIASGTTQHTQHVVDNGAIPLFVQLLSSPSQDVREQAVWALGNIAGDTHQFRDLVLKLGAMEPLLKLTTTNSPRSLLRNATWTLSNLCRGKPQPDFELVKPALRVLANLIYNADEEILTDSCWALSYLSDDTGTGNQKIQAVIASGVCRRLVELLMHANVNIKTPALRTVGNIVTGDDLQTQVVMNQSVLPCLLALLDHPRKALRKEACWTLSNITAGNSAQIQAVLDANIFPRLVNLLSQDVFDIKKEALWAISNATSGGTPEQISYLVLTAEAMPALVSVLGVDAAASSVALDGLENMLRTGLTRGGSGHNEFANLLEEKGGVDALEELQTHENVELFEKAKKLLNTYFAAEEEVAW